MNNGTKWMVASHIGCIDFICDLALFIATIADKSYKLNYYIYFDLALKTFIIIRGIVWIPCVVLSDEFDVKGMHLDFEPREALKDTSEQNEGQPGADDPFK